MLYITVVARTDISAFIATLPFWAVPRGEGAYFVREGFSMPQHNQLSFATSSPLFVPDTCLYSNALEDQKTIEDNRLKTVPLGLLYMPNDIILAIALMRDNSMRASELLALRLSDNLHSNVFLVRGMKRSRNYTIVIPGRWVCRPQRSDPRWTQHVFPFDYNYLYKWFCRSGLGGSRAGRKNNVRTHVYRYISAAAAVEHSTLVCASDVLHHNSKRSVNYYIDKQESTNGKD